MKFVHIGVPTTEVKPGEIYAAGMKVHVTDPAAHPYKFEYLRFDADTWLPQEMQNQPHIAIQVDSIAAELAKADRVLVEPTVVDEHLTICFAMVEGVIFEWMEMK